MNVKRPSLVPNPLMTVDQRVAGVDGLRAVAMTMVIAQHCGLLPFGWVGVWLFFVISGYVITCGFQSEEAQGGFRKASSSRYLSFLRRRLLRIVPAYALYVGTCALIFSLLYGAAGFGDLLGLATFIYNWQMIYQPDVSGIHWPALGHLWTLSIEQQFYLFYPLMFLGLPERLRWKVAIFLVLIAPLVRWIWLVFATATLPSLEPGRLAFSVYAATICQFDAFLLGALIARYQVRLLDIKKLPSYLLAIAGCVLAVYVIVYAAQNHGRGDRGLALIKNLYSGILYGQGRELFVYSAINLFAAAVLLSTLAHLRGTKWLSNEWVSWVGRVSYGGYLFHALILWSVVAWIGKDWNQASVGLRLMVFSIVFLTTIGTASISFIHFERPLAQRFKNWAAGNKASNQMSVVKT